MNCKKCKTELVPDAAYCHACGVAVNPSREPKKRGNGQGTVYKRGKTWTAYATKFISGKRITKTRGGFERKRDALEWLKTRDIKKGVVTLARLYDEWSDSAGAKLSESKQTAYKIAKNRIAPIAYTPIAELTVKQLQDCISSLSYYPARDVKSLLSHLYRRACAQDDARTNLSTFMVLPPLIEGEAEAFTEEELKKLWAAYSDGDIIVGFHLLMIYTGMMPGELLACKKSMIDYDRQAIVGCGKKTKERKEKPIILPNVIIPVLKSLCNSHNRKSLVGMNKDKFYSEYYIALDRIGVRALPPYSCRHTTATALAIGDKVAPALITKVMRQRRAITTERYKHAEEAEVLKALNQLEKSPITNTLPTNGQNMP